MKTLVSCLLLLAAGLGPSHAQEAGPAPTPGPVALADGDTFLFLGDSITHQCLYTQYVETYYFTRYPQQRLKFYNAGISGDRAPNALARFEGDVAAQKPKYATVLLGMNDASYVGFKPEIFATYEAKMTELLDKLQAEGITPVLMGPTLYDSRVSKVNPPKWVAKDAESQRQLTQYYNPVLSFFAAWLRDRAIERGLHYVDLIGPMAKATAEQRRDNPAFNMVPDAVHPDPNGQLVMAFTILEGLGANRQVSSLNAQRRGDKWSVAGGKGTVADVKGDAKSLEFTFTAPALPWVLPEEAALGYKLAKAGHKMSNERLVIGGLMPGRYDLFIDDIKIGTYPHNRLAAKIELQENKLTPQYQQALQVAWLNKERNAKAVKPLRGIWAKRRGRVGKPDLADWEEKFLKPRLAELKEIDKEFTDRIYAANQPHPRRYRIVAAEVAAPAKKAAAIR